MHELSVAQRIIEVIEREVARSGINRVCSARLRIGKMAAFQREQLEFCLATYGKGGALEGMTFEIEEVPVRLACRACGHLFPDGRFDDEAFAHEIAHSPLLYAPSPCPSCSSGDVEVSSGRELELVELEGEETGGR